MPAGNDGHRRERRKAKAVVKALNHPLRVEILELLCCEGEMSPRKISASLGQPISAVAYHVKVLSHECELLELVKEVPKRGATEHFYRSKLDAVEPHIASFQASINNLLEAAEESIDDGE